MSRKFIVAIAAVAAIGLSTLISTDAFARGGGGSFGGGGGRGGHVGMSHGGGHVGRTAFHGRTTSTRNVTRNVSRGSHVNKTRHAGRGPNMKRPHHPHRHHIARHHHRHHWWWCRHHPYRCGGTWGVDVVGVDGGVAPIPVAAAPVVAAAPAAAVCTNDCDYFLKEEPGCYMAKRAFSTPVGEELRCVKICDESEGKRADIK